MKYLLIFFLLITLISSCHKDKSPIEKFDSSNFPISVGSWWKYKHVNFLANTTDTMLLSVISTNTNVSNKEYVCIIEEYGQTVDTAIVSIDESLIKYQGVDFGYSYFGNFLLKIPFTVGSEWRNQSTGDSTKVISYSENVKILDKSYDIYFLKRTAYGLGYSLLQTISVAKGVGVVEHNLSFFNGGPVQHQNLKLIDYELR